MPESYDGVGAPASRERVTLVSQRPGTTSRLNCENETTTTTVAGYGNRTCSGTAL